MFDLTEVKPNEFVRYGLACLEKVAGEGDECAKECRARLRIMVSSSTTSNVYPIAFECEMEFGLVGCRRRWYCWLGSWMSSRV